MLKQRMHSGKPAQAALSYTHTHKNLFRTNISCVDASGSPALRVGGKLQSVTVDLFLSLTFGRAFQRGEAINVATDSDAPLFMPERECSEGFVIFGM